MREKNRYTETDRQCEKEREGEKRQRVTETEIDSATVRERGSSYLLKFAE